MPQEASSTPGLLWVNSHSAFRAQLVRPLLCAAPSASPGARLGRRDGIPCRAGSSCFCAGQRGTRQPCTRPHLGVGPGQQLQPAAPVANDVVFNDDRAVAFGDDAVASVVIDAVAPELHLALGLDLDPTLAVARDAVVGHAGELAALGHSDASVAIGMDHVGGDVQGLAALDVQS